MGNFRVFKICSFLRYFLFLVTWIPFSLHGQYISYPSGLKTYNFSKIETHGSSEDSLKSKPEIKEHIHNVGQIRHFSNWIQEGNNLQSPLLIKNQNYSYEPPDPFFLTISSFDKVLDRIAESLNKFYSTPDDYFTLTTPKLLNTSVESQFFYDHFGFLNSIKTSISTPLPNFVPLPYSDQIRQKSLSSVFAPIQKSHSESISSFFRFGLSNPRSSVLHHEKKISLITQKVSSADKSDLSSIPISKNWKSGRRSRPNWSGAATVYNWEISDFDGTAGNGYDKFLFGNLDFSGGNKFKIQILPVHGMLPDNNISDSGNTAGFSSVQNTYQSKNFSFLSADGTITGLSSNVNDSFEIDSNAFSYYVGHWYGDWSVSHDGSGNFSLNYVAVPEPSTYAMVFSLFGFIYLSTKPGNLLSGFFLTVARRKKSKGLISNELQEEKK